MNFRSMLAALLLLCSFNQARAADPPQFHELFNGKDLSGWVNANTDKGSWSVLDGVMSLQSAF